MLRIISALAVLLLFLPVASLSTAGEQGSRAGEQESNSSPGAGQDAAQQTAPTQAGALTAGQKNQQPGYETLRLRGKVFYLAEALQERFGIKTVPGAAERQLVLVSPGGELHPIVEDIRGRAFRRDKRLRERPLVLMVRRYHGSPFVQVIRIFTDKSDGLYELDYWCEICSIAMFELKPCDCCQGDIELRERLVEPKGDGRESDHQTEADDQAEAAASE